ncbi:hypothetical protein DRF65_05140 [Chryseobacterium pennae]|uniref:Uncharacterized protein n=1 Tax=Chryseobacterium pennae TaxID=2258962 RepID=A0A3D9CCM9_9FLAO|nr:hypothetical protein [Chryseobacterium pennae]REC63484.1 hypothetical protein DRF65_05140 [Chryseobacterium pennae]
MRSLKKLDITKSIQSKKLIFEEEWLDQFDNLILYVLFLMLAGISIWGFRKTILSLNNSLEYTILVCLFFSSLYLLYCKFTEKHLKEVKFNISKNEAKDRIIRYAQKRYRISRPANNLIYLNEPIDLYSPGIYEQTTIIFFKDHSILYTLIKEGSKSNFPVLLSQHLMRMDLKKILQQKKIETKAKNKGYFSSLFHG